MSGKLLAVVARGLEELSLVYNGEHVVDVYLALHPMVDEEVVRKAWAMVGRGVLEERL